MRIIISLVLLLFFAMLFSSCKHENNDLILIKIMSSDLKNAQGLVESHTLELYQGLESRANDPKTASHGVIWEKKALQIKSASAEWKEYLNKAFTVDQPDWAVFKNKSDQIKQKLKSIDDTMNLSLSKEIDLLIKPLDSVKNHETFFSSMSESSRHAVLTELLYDISSLEYELVSYCSSQYNREDNIAIDKMSFLVGQNTTHLRKGEVLDISSGVVAFTSATNTKIIIDGKNCGAMDGQAEYKIQVNDLPGKYSKKVHYEYTDQHGMHKSGEANVNYTVDE